MYGGLKQDKRTSFGYILEIKKPIKFHDGKYRNIRSKCQDNDQQILVLKKNLKLQSKMNLITSFGYNTDNIM